MRNGTGRRADSAIVHRARRGASGRVGQGADRARPGSPDRRHDRRHDGHGGRHADHDADRREVQSGRTGCADQARTRVREERRRQPTDDETGGRGDEGENELLSEEDAGHEGGRGADGFQQSDPPRLVLHPATHEQRDAGQSEEPQEGAPGEQDRPLNGDDEPVLGGDGLPGDEKEVTALMRRGEGGGVGGIGQLQVECVTERATRLSGQLRGGRAGDPDETSFGKSRRMGKVTERRRLERRRDGDPHDREGGADCTQWSPARPWTPLCARRWTVPATDKRVQADAVADLEIEEFRQAALDDHAALGHPVPSGEFGLVDGCSGRIAALGYHRIGMTVDDQVRCRHQVGPAGVDDARRVLESGQRRGQSKSLLHGGHHVGPCSRRPGRLVRCVRHPAQGEGDGERGRGGDDGDEQHHRFGRISPNVLHREAGHKQQASHRSAPQPGEIGERPRRSPR